MKTCVTGGAGYIGSHLISTLIDQGHEVVCIDSLENGNRIHPKSRFFSNDIREIQGLEGVLKGTEVFFHLAADKRAASTDYYDMISTNVAGTAAVLEMAKRVGARRMVFSSSCAVYTKEMYEKGPVSENVTDKDRGTQQNVYGLSKLLCEDLCNFMADDTLSVVSLRYFNVWGGHYLESAPVHKSVIEIFMDKTNAGLPINIYGDGSIVRDFVHVNDVVKANLLAVDHQCKGNSVFNICTGVATKVMDIADMVCGKDYPKKVFLPERSNELPWCVGKGNLAEVELGWTPDHHISELVDFVRKK
jgi:UDP-glucose 4-epimerase